MAKTVSVTTTPPISSATPMPMIVTIGIAAFFSAWPISTLSLRQPLGVGGADVVLRQHVEHAGAGHARDQRDVDHAERDARQDQMCDRNGPDAVA